jgi:transcriptional accessory protein Tex/SPT6
MSSAITIDLRHAARGLSIPLRRVQVVVELLDEGNTIPFITRYRRDQTGGLDEEQIRLINARLTKLRMLADRKQAILRSIESQGKLTKELAQQILAAGTTKRLEDLYLPYRPKKQTLAAQARSRGLDELAAEILAAVPSCADLLARASDFVNPDKQVPSAADALLGAGHILAEQFSENAELRRRLREILRGTGKIVSSQAPTPPAAAGEVPGAREAAPAAEVASASEAAGVEVAAAGDAVNAVEAAAVENRDGAAALKPPSVAAVEPPGAAPSEGAAPTEGAVPAEGASTSTATATTAPATQRAVSTKAAAKLSLADLKKKRLEQRRIKAYRDYFNYSEQVRKIPPHRVLAINRGERAKVLRVRLEYDLAAMQAAVDELLIPPGHPHADYLRGCALDALTRLILPSLERELRRELTEKAEARAVEVFAKNLRNLLLQPPVRDKRVLAIDPGYKSGCKLAALDQFGNLLEHAVIYLVGRPERRAEAAQKIVDLIDRHQLNVLAIGNGTACRAAEEFVVGLLSNQLQGRGICYVIVNEAGASVYSTSSIGREEFPNYDAGLRGAISIGRRLLDPLSELVKIEPANIGVGLYQHDVKAQHLRASLDEVVESCVNYVGVDVNTASSALLRYVSGLNQLTARRLYDYRREHGPFRNRQQLREVPGFGERTFIQAAGFLKITGGDNPLDATWIHPESYPVVEQLLENLGYRVADLADKQKAAEIAARLNTIDRAVLAKELNVGRHTFEQILAQLARPGRDPREDLPPPVFKQGVLKLEDLEPGMELMGTVLNVVDFGAFVDIGMHDCGLVHVSHLADKFVRDPHEVVAAGDIVRVWILGVDRQRRRVSLSMVPPGTERSRSAGRSGEQSQPQPQRGKSSPSARKGNQGLRPPAATLSRDGQPATTSIAGAAPPASRPAGQQPSPPPASGTAPPPSRPQRDRQREQRREQDREQRHERRHEGRRRHRSGGTGRSYQAPPPPRPATPITEAMKEGKEPMRTFADLLQFYAARQQQPSPPPETTPSSAEKSALPPSTLPAASLSSSPEAASAAACSPGAMTSGETTLSSAGIPATKAPSHPAAATGNDVPSAKVSAVEQDPNIIPPLPENTQPLPSPSTEAAPPEDSSSPPAR